MIFILYYYVHTYHEKIFMCIIIIIMYYYIIITLHKHIWLYFFDKIIYFFWRKAAMHFSTVKLFRHLIRNNCAGQHSAHISNHTRLVSNVANVSAGDGPWDVLIFSSLLVLSLSSSPLWRNKFNEHMISSLSNNWYSGSFTSAVC